MTKQSNDSYHRSLWVRVVSQIAIDELPHCFLQARREYVGRARSSPKLSLPDAITILRDTKKTLAKNEHGQTSAQTHCDANNRNDCPSLAICDWFEFGTNLGNITHGYQSMHYE